jgi:DNA modification methylase
MTNNTLSDFYPISYSEKLVSFRNLVPDIPSTTYASHGMYYYPAKFIPQVVRWAIEEYTEVGDWVIDPFAGSGTVCIESQITGRNSVNLDLNPLIEELLKAKTIKGVLWEELEHIAIKIMENQKEFHPKWSRIHYWHPDEFFTILSKMWYVYYDTPHPLILIALLQTTKRYSFGDDEIPKLFKSKRKTEWVKETLTLDYQKQINDFFWKSLKKVYLSSKEFEKCSKNSQKSSYIAKGDVDQLNYPLNGEYSLLITSPPYGLAHEYIRSVKLDLAWLNFDDVQIRELGKKEIPYNKNVPDLKIESNTFQFFNEKVRDDIKIYSITYFKSILFILEKVMSRLKSGGTAAIFVGNATFSGVEMPYHQIFREHLESKGYRFERLLEDKIQGRRLFKKRNNLSPNGIESEYLLILKKD